MVLQDEQNNDMQKVTTHLEKFSINYSLEMYHFFEFSERCILKENFFPMIKPLNEQGQFVNASFSLFLLLHFDCLFLGRPVLRLSYTRS